MPVLQVPSNPDFFVGFLWVFGILTMKNFEGGDGGEGGGSMCSNMIDLWLEMSFEMKK